MGEMEKRQLLSTEKVSMLADMGIQVWYERLPEAIASPLPETESPQPTPEPTVPSEALPAAVSEAPPAAVIVEFCWLKHDSGLVAYPLTADAAAVQVLKDILSYGAWVNSRGEASLKARPAQGDFRWPQLVESSGTPLRALAAFYDKHFAEQAAWILLTAEVAPMLQPWLQELAETLPIKLVELPALHLSVSDPASKKQIWQILHQSL